MSYTIVNNGKTTSTTNGSAIAVSLTITAATNGNTLILGIISPTSSPVPSPSCTNVSWTLITSQVSNFTSTGYTMYVWYGSVSGGNSGTTISATITNSTTSDGIIMQYAEVSGIAASSPLDGTAQSNAQASSSVNTLTVTSSITTTTNANDIIFAYFSVTEQGPGVTPATTYTNSFTNINNNNLGGPIVLGTGLAYYVPGTTGAFASAENFTSSVAVAQYGQSIIFAMLPTGGGGQGINTAIVIGNRRRIICSM